MTVALGREERIFVVPESSFGAADSAPAAGNAMKILESSVTPNEERIIRADKRNTRSAMDFVRRRQSVEWSLKSYLLPSGSLGTAPDGMDDLLEIAFGTETVNGSTSVVYDLAKELASSVTIHRAVGQSASSAVFAEMIRGAVVNQATFDMSGSEETMVTFEGMGADILRAGASTVDSDDGDDVAVASGDGPKFDVGQYINVDDQTDLEITAKSGDTLTTTNHTGQDNGDAVVPSACVTSQTFQSGAVPIAGIAGSSSLDSSTFNVVSAQVVLNNNLKMHNDRFGTAKAQDFHANNRQVTGSLTIRLTDSNFLQVAQSRGVTEFDLQLVSGDTDGSKAQFDLNQLVFDLTAIPSNAEEDILVTLPFTALGSSGDDELKLTLI